jgi:ubiquinone/menaquinone biosynthesis C-methylase UbiE
MLGRWYGYLATMLVASPIVCLNYGYVPLRDGELELELQASQEPMRHYLQLYAHVAEALDWAGRDALEISCGYGGGAAFVHGRMRPRSYVAIDLTEAPLRAARQRFGASRLSFLTAKADSLGLASEAFDIVISVEASHCYPNMSRFVAEVTRVLRPGGKLVLADYRPVAVMSELKSALARSGLTLRGMADITANVLQSLDETDEQRRQWIARYGPIWLRPFMGQLAGVKGSIVYRGFHSGRLTYQRLLLEKA